MKLSKIIGVGALTLLAPLFATSAQAATILCTPINNDAINNFVVTPIVVFDCPAYDAPGTDLITSVTLDVLITWQDSDLSNGAHVVQGVATEDSVQIAGATSTVTTTASGTGLTGEGATVGFFSGTFAKTGGAVANLLTLNAFHINVAVPIPSFIPVNSTISTRFTTTEIPGTPVPEPASMLLLGTGLAGLAAKARRRRAAKK